MHVCKSRSDLPNPLHHLCAQQTQAVATKRAARSQLRDQQRRRARRVRLAASTRGGRPSRPAAPTAWHDKQETISNHADGPRRASVVNYTAYPTIPRRYWRSAGWERGLRKRWGSTVLTCAAPSPGRHLHGGSSFGIGAAIGDSGIVGTQTNKRKNERVRTFAVRHHEA